MGRPHRPQLCRPSPQTDFFGRGGERGSNHKPPITWENIEDPVVLLERNLYGPPLAGLLWKKQFEEALGMYVRASKTKIILVDVRG